MFTDGEVIAMLRNVGVDVDCGACMEVAFTGVTTNAHTCQSLAGNPATTEVSSTPAASPAQKENSHSKISLSPGQLPHDGERYGLSKSMNKRLAMTGTRCDVCGVVPDPYQPQLTCPESTRGRCPLLTVAAPPKAK